ncbi:hypothetical protein [Minwuia sp.]|uniref:hypothetical protein n=1 Tax=Minwuia sp. TaxID=2493630 RepID=UPI003A8DD7BA
MNRQKLRDAALLLPLIGLFLLMPPFVGLLSGPARLAGVPAIVVYIFAVWAMLIALGFLLSRRLSTGGEAASTEPPPAEPSDADT